MQYHTYMNSPVGQLLLISDGTSLTGMHMLTTRPPLADSIEKKVPVLAAAQDQLTEYFAGTRTVFELPLALHGTEFQKRVWMQLIEIPFGQTISYGELARRVGDPKASRAVGMANGKNPVAIIVPCHRVIGANGSLTGFASGLERKKILLDLESTAAVASPFENNQNLFALI